MSSRQNVGQLKKLVNKHARRSFSDGGSMNVPPFSKIILHNIVLVLLFLNIVRINVYAKIYDFTVLEKVRESELIILAKCINIKSKKYDIVHPKMPDKTFKATRFATYKILEILKGKYDKDTLLLDFKLTNEKCKPIICSSPLHPSPSIDEQVILFLKEDFEIFAGFQGKVSVEKEKVALYRNAINKFIKLDTLGGRKKILVTIKMIDDDNRHVRESISRELHEVDNTIYGIQIANLLKHKEISVRQGAMSALIRTKDKRVVPLVISALKDSDPNVRRDAATVLWRIDDERITPALIKSYDDEYPDVRRSIIFALSHRHCKEAMPLYLKAMKDEDPIVRSFGISSFEWVNNPEVVPELLNALKDENSRVRESAIRILYVYIRCHIIKPTNDIIDSVASLLDDTDSRIRDQSSFFFIELGSTGYKDFFSDRIIKKLLNILETDRNLQVRETALRALGTISSPKLIPTFSKYLSDTQWGMRSCAAIALARTSDKKVLSKLKKALKDEKNEYVKSKIQIAIKMLEEK